MGKTGKAEKGVNKFIGIRGNGRLWEPAWKENERRGDRKKKVTIREMERRAKIGDYWPKVQNLIQSCKCELLQLKHSFYRSELCVPVADVAGHGQLRSASRGLLNFPRYNMSNYGRRAFCFAGPYVWNSIPEHIRQSTSIAVFKRSLKTFLLKQISHQAH